MTEESWAAFSRSVRNVARLPQSSHRARRQGTARQHGRSDSAARHGSPPNRSPSRACGDRRQPPDRIVQPGRLNPSNDRGSETRCGRSRVQASSISASSHSPSPHEKCRNSPHIIRRRGRLGLAVAGRVVAGALSAPEREAARPRRNIARRGSGPARLGCRRRRGHERCPPKAYTAVIDELRARYKAAARKRDQRDDDCTHTAEITDELEHLTRIAGVPPRGIGRSGI